MTRNEFEELQLNLQQSDMNLKSYLKHIGTSYSTYRYWHKKYSTQSEESRELAPITFRKQQEEALTITTFSENMPSGATLLFPNGLRAHFGSGTESVLMDLLNKSLTANVLP